MLFDNYGRYDLNEVDWANYWMALESKDLIYQWIHWHRGEVA
tara:strand:- start:286 stop:411 length:126 start_codon:yes stop_codon:yes gene_type:complete